MPMQSLWHDSEHTPLAERHEQLRRTSQAMWRLLKSRLDLSDDDLHSALSRIELEENKQHIQVLPQSQLLECKLCRHPVRSTARCCLYCGTPPQHPLATGSVLRARHTQQ
jgi:hypothetical protein